MQKYDVPELFQLTSLEPDRDIVLRIAESENDVALEEDAQYMLQLSILREMSGLAVHFTTRVVNVSVQDPDCELIITCNADTLHYRIMPLV